MSSIAVGPLSLSVAHVLIIAAFVVALLVGAVAGRRDQVKVGGPLADILLWSLLCARIGFVALYFEHYWDDPLGIIDIRDGGFHLLSGLIGCAIATTYQLWRHPSVRGALGIAVTTGILLWALPWGLITLMQVQGQGIPEVTVESRDGEARALDTMADGRPMVVNLWASWCPPCVREMPVLEKAQEAQEDIAFVFVNQGEGPPTVNSFLDEHGLTLRNVVLDRRREVASNTGNQGLPTTLFYNASGQLVTTHYGELSSATLADNLSEFETNTGDNN
ncbi:thiol-disulfide isomerase/thioredoxin [Halospina denitrificans]|uniref:Thiol-disulfide isomerase/thioredoxin n=1 Tax=Halospina denitrificans TaxID=332522 RepID=A0A4R7JU70_9GAMM|nr:TlpA disulfide reductase family protein [Halospina denitrificans]TDT41454.1 thiol-disulfide isomerase/thioredoxin [Halospina denitrificans]